MPRQFQEFMLVLPTKRFLLELFGLVGWEWWLRDLGNEVSGGGFCKPVDQNANKRDLDEDIESQAESKQYTSTVFEPQLLLFFVVLDARKVGLELRLY
jgi:hypothetical protein